MAAFEIIYTVIDDSGERGTTSIKVPTGFSLSQFQEFGASMATLVDAILSGKVEKGEICFGVDVSGLLNNVNLTTSDVKEIGAFSAVTTGGFSVGVNVPAINEAKVLSGSDDLDLTDPDIAAFVSMLETGIAVTGGTVEPCDVAEDSISNVVSARERFRASGKRR